MFPRLSGHESSRTAPRFELCGALTTLDLQTVLLFHQSFTLNENYTSQNENRATRTERDFHELRDFQESVLVSRPPPSGRKRREEVRKKEGEEGMEKRRKKGKKKGRKEGGKEG